MFSFLPHKKRYARLLALIALLPLSSCSFLLKKTIGLKDPKVESRESILHHLAKNNIPLSNHYVMKGSPDSSLIYKNMMRGFKGGMMIFDSAGRKYCYRGTEKCNGKQLRQAHSQFEQLYVPCRKDTALFQTLMTTISPLSAITPDTSSYTLVLFWSKFSGKKSRIGEDYQWLADLQKNSAFRPRLLLVNCDLLDEWGLKPKAKMKLRFRLESKRSASIEFGPIPYAKGPQQKIDSAIATPADEPKKLSRSAKDSIQGILLTVDIEDQKHRNRMDSVRLAYGGDSKELKALMKAMKATDSLNLVKVSGIINTYGWLGEKDIGSLCNTTLFMVIQHSDLTTQVAYLPLMREAVKQGNARAASLALLEDRVALLEGKRQTYGSQLSWNMKTNVYVVMPLEDPDRVDERRAAMGLEPMASYIGHCCNLLWDVDKYKKELPALEEEFFRSKK